MNRKIIDKIAEVAGDEQVKEALNALFMFEVDQGSGGFQYSAEYEAILEKHMPKPEAGRDGGTPK